MSKSVISGLISSPAQLIGAAISAGLLLFGSAHAQSVQSIKSAGVIKVGAQVAQVPWGFSDEAGKLTGFDIEVAQAVAKGLGVDAKFTPVTPANRTAALLTGQVEMLAAVMGVYADRQKVVLFSRPYANVDTCFIAGTARKISGWKDLDALRVGLAKGTPQDIALTKAAPPGTTILRFDDDATAVQALIAGQVDVVGTAVNQLAYIAKIAGPGKFENKFSLVRQYSAIAVRPDARELVDAINIVLSKMVASGELAALYKKWTGADLSPLPETGEGPAALPVVITAY
jgi:polar amino acid transport system substrate-binding protein